jgi:hypothetical protein
MLGGRGGGAGGGAVEYVEYSTNLGNTVALASFDGWHAAEGVPWGTRPGSMQVRAVAGGGLLG